MPENIAIPAPALPGREGREGMAERHTSPEAGTRRDRTATQARAARRVLLRLRGHPQRLAGLRGRPGEPALRWRPGRRYRAMAPTTSARPVSAARPARARVTI